MTEAIETQEATGMEEKEEEGEPAEVKGHLGMKNL